METLDLSASPWKTYSILAQIAAQRGREVEAAQWRRKEQDTYAAYPGSSLSVQKWQEKTAVIAAAYQGNVEARDMAEQILAHFQESEDWGKLMEAFRRVFCRGNANLKPCASDLTGLILSSFTRC